MDKITFRKQAKETGLRAIGNPYPNTDIKLNGKYIGYINAPDWNSASNQWVINFRVIKNDINEDKNPNCSWKWIKVKQEFDTEDCARLYIKDHLSNIVKLNFYYDKED